MGLTEVRVQILFWRHEYWVARNLEAELHGLWRGILPLKEHNISGDCICSDALGTEAMPLVCKGVENEQHLLKSKQKPRALNSPGRQ